MNKDGSKMSKRDQGASVDYYIKRGYRPEAVRNYLSLLGWSPKDNREKMTIEETTKIFDLNNVVRSHATFDPAKLHWLNGEYARELDDNTFHDLAVAALKSGGVALDNFPENYVRAAIQTCKGKINTFDELPTYCGFYFTMTSFTSRKASRNISPLKTSRVCKQCGTPWPRYRTSMRQKSKAHSSRRRQRSA